ncbi:hypothetical protein CTRI78_v002029 [Colletotrichum trifolii]|uniref:Uncharacterized protein n=1 Tax=Colletotrichum trifolii TaxID=5466 RepID=A0A4R8RMK5_COLTR|nr:hypothetical protein CTRI78_v002029 [Colletotrichum trifolii]
MHALLTATFRPCYPCHTGYNRKTQKEKSRDTFSLGIIERKEKRNRLKPTHDLKTKREKASPLTKHTDTTQSQRLQTCCSAVSSPAKVPVDDVHCAYSGSHQTPTRLAVHAGEYILEARILASFGVSQIALVELALASFQDGAVDGPRPHVVPLILRYSHVLATDDLSGGGVSLPARKGPLGLDDLEALRAEEEVGPSEEPEEGQVEEPAHPGGEAPAVDTAGVVDVDPGVVDGEAHVDAAAVVGGADEVLQTSLEPLIVVETRHGARQGKSLEAGVRGAVAVAPLAQGGRLTPLDDAAGRGATETGGAGGVYGAAAHL